MKIEMNELGGARIDDGNGRVAIFRDAEIMAAHFATLLEEYQKAEGRLELFAAIGLTVREDHSGVEYVHDARQGLARYPEFPATTNHSER